MKLGYVQNEVIKVVVSPFYSIKVALRLVDCV
jgi:hypothetical protein